MNEPPRRVVFLCGHQSLFGLAPLDALFDSSFGIVAVGLATDARWETFRTALDGEQFDFEHRRWRRFAGLRRIARRVRALTGLPNEMQRRRRRVLAVARRHGVAVVPLDDVNAAPALERLRSFAPDLILTAAYPQIFGRELLDLPARGCVNLHPSPLPRFRGAHPHFWTIATGAAEAGLTAHLMTEELDAGDVVARIRFPVEGRRYDELTAELLRRTPELVRGVEAFFSAEDTVAEPQRLEDGSRFRNPRALHARVFWRIHTAAEVHDLIRTGRAFCFFRGRKLRLLDGFVTETNRNLTNDVRVEPGTIVDVDPGRLVVRAADGCVNVTRLRDGRREPSIPRWVRRRRVHLGEVLG